MIMYCFAFFFFSCEERPFQRYLSEDDAVDHGDSDDYYSASQEELRWKEGEAAQSQLWVMQTARFLPRILFFFFPCWNMQGFLLLRVVLKIYMDFGMFSMKMI